MKSVEVGKASVVDVLLLQIRTNEIQQLIRFLEQQYISEQTNFNKLLNRDKDTAINTLNALDIPSVDFEMNPEKLVFSSRIIKIR